MGSETSEPWSAMQMLDWLRKEGWMVAVHNDYRVGGALMTFWLFTHQNGRWIKGEGPNDLVALSLCIVEHKHLFEAEPGLTKATGREAGE